MCTNCHGRPTDRREIGFSALQCSVSLHGCPTTRRLITETRIYHHSDGQHGCASNFDIARGRLSAADEHFAHLQIPGEAARERQGLCKGSSSIPVPIARKHGMDAQDDEDDEEDQLIDDDKDLRPNIPRPSDAPPKRRANPKKRVKQKVEDEKKLVLPSALVCQRS